MITTDIKALAVTRARVARLEKAIATRMGRELAEMPAKFGFSSVDSFVNAVEKAARANQSRRLDRPTKPAIAPKRRKRANITDATRAKVKKLVESGMTGSQIAKAVKISLPTVQNIKKSLGLVKGTKKTTAKKLARSAPAKRTPAPKTRKIRVVSKKAPAPEAKPVQASTEATPSPSA